MGEEIPVDRRQAMNKKSLAALLTAFVLAGSLGTVCLGATTETEASSDGDVASSGDTGGPGFES